MQGAITRRKACRIALAAIGTALVGTTGAGCSKAASSAGGKGTLKVGVRSDIVNFSQLNASNGKYYGMEIDLARELAGRLGFADADFLTVTPTDREEKLSKGSVDCLIACYSASASRKKRFDFSPSYYTDSVILVVENTALIDSVAGLSGKTIGVMRGANTGPQLADKLFEMGLSAETSQTHSQDAEEISYDTWTLRQLKSYAELSDALECGAVDAMAMDGAIAQTYLNDERTILSDFDINPQRYAVATEKGSDLSERVADCIRAMRKDKTIDKLIDKWD